MTDLEGARTRGWRNPETLAGVVPHSKTGTNREELAPCSGLIATADEILSNPSGGFHVPAVDLVGVEIKEDAKTYRQGLL